MTRFLTVVALAVSFGGSALADIDRREAEGSVDDAMTRLTAAVETAGATIFATVDHAAGAQGAGLELPQSRLLIFGNPQLGTPVMQADMLAGLSLPLKILVYADEDGQTYVAYEEIDSLFEGLDIGGDLGVLQKMEGALDNFAAAAAAGP